MKQTSTTAKVIATIVLMLSALPSQALTLGRASGAVIVGQPLDLRIGVSLDEPLNQRGQAELCFEAEVFQGETRVAPHHVSVQSDVALGAREAHLRVRSNALVDEPVVTLFLRVGCKQRVTRRYVLLAEMLTDVALPPQIPVAAPPRGNVNGSAFAERADSLAAAPVVRPILPVAPTRVVRKVSRAKLVAPVTAVQGRPRLKLDVADLSPVPDGGLKPTVAMGIPVAENLQLRDEALALWRALNTQPQDVIRDAQRIQGLEADMKALRELTARNDALLTELTAQMRRSETNRTWSGLIYAVGGFLVAAVLGALFLRQQRPAYLGLSWSRRTPSGQPATAPFLDTADRRDQAEPAKAGREAVGGRRPPVVGPAGPRSAWPVSEHSEPGDGSSLHASRHLVKAEELFDMQEQADFFVSLGQHDRAIEILKHHIRDNDSTSALAYLDLLRIYHLLDRNAEYNQMCADFNRVFNVEAPQFEDFAGSGRGLEAYQSAMSRIEALWPSAKVVEVIEESIFRKPTADDGRAFDIDAYRELLLLYAIAKELLRQDAGDHLSSEPSVVEVAPSSMEGAASRASARFMSTSIQPLSTEVKAAARLRVDTTPVSKQLEPDVPKPIASPRLSLDIDLEGLDPPTASEPMPLDKGAMATTGSIPMKHLAQEPSTPGTNDWAEFDDADYAKRPVAPRSDRKPS